MRGKEQIRGRKRQREKGLGRERDNDGREREKTVWVDFDRWSKSTPGYLSN